MCNDKKIVTVILINAKNQLNDKSQCCCEDSATPCKHSGALSNLTPAQKAWQTRKMMAYKRKCSLAAKKAWITIRKRYFCPVCGRKCKCKK